MSISGRPKDSRGSQAARPAFFTHSQQPSAPGSSHTALTTHRRWAQTPPGTQDQHCQPHLQPAEFAPHRSCQTKQPHAKRCPSPSGRQTRAQQHVMRTVGVSRDKRDTDKEGWQSSYTGPSGASAFQHFLYGF